MKRRPRRPSRSQRMRQVRLLAAYILADGAHIRIQQRKYDSWMGALVKLESDYPEVSMRDEVTMSTMVTLAKAEADKKVFRGPGATT